jgi:hypothetical protein
LVLVASAPTTPPKAPAYVILNPATIDGDASAADGDLVLAPAVVDPVLGERVPRGRARAPRTVKIDVR